MWWQNPTFWARCSHRNHKITSIAACAGSAQDSALNSYAWMEDLLRSLPLLLLDWWQLMDSGRGEVIPPSCVLTGEPIKLQWICLSPRSQRQPRLNSVVHKTRKRHGLFQFCMVSVYHTSAAYNWLFIFLENVIFSKPPLRSYSLTFHFEFLG